MVIIYLLIGITAGLHRASWGAYKDSPYEPFQLNKYLRSVIVSVLFAFLLYMFRYFLPGLTLIHVYLITILCDTIILEVYKLCIRTEKQDRYAIPSNLHIFKKPVTSIFFKLLIAYLIFAALFAFSIFFSMVDPHPSKALLLTLVIGLFAGTLEAFGGSWKDAPFENFYFNKFMRSPLVGMTWSIILSFISPNGGILFLSILGANRMTIEVYKAFMRGKGIKSGKFKRNKPEFPEWIEKRTVFIYPYVYSWIVYLALLVYTFVSVL